MTFAIAGSRQRFVRRALGRSVRGALMVALAILGSAAAAAQNLVLNGDFHTDPVGWDLQLGTQLLWTDLTEEGGCAASGSGLVPSELATGVHRAAISQCITLHDEPNIFARVRHQGYGTFTLRLDFRTALNCAAGVLTWATTTQVQDPVSWQTLLLSAVPPSNANGVIVTLRAEDGDPHGMLVDGVSVTSRWPIFLDGFDGNDPGENTPCRWGS